MEVEKVHLGQSVCKRETAHNLLLLLTLCPCSHTFIGLSQTISTGTCTTVISDAAFELVCEQIGYNFDSV